MHIMNVGSSHCGQVEIFSDLTGFLNEGRDLHIYRDFNETGGRVNSSVKKWLSGKKAQNHLEL